MIIEETITINASPQDVWDVFTRVFCWSDWNYVLTHAHSEKECICCGNRLNFCITPFFIPVKMSVEILKTKEHELVVWQTRQAGFRAVHEFSFRKTENGVTVISRETFFGSLGGILVTLFGKRIHSLTKLFLKDLQTACERKNGGRLKV